jgi:hypothetical protein
VLCQVSVSGRYVTTIQVISSHTTELPEALSYPIPELTILTIFCHILISRPIPRAIEVAFVSILISTSYWRIQQQNRALNDYYSILQLQHKETAEHRDKLMDIYPHVKRKWTECIAARDKCEKDLEELTKKCDKDQQKIKQCEKKSWKNSSLTVSEVVPGGCAGVIPGT